MANGGTGTELLGQALNENQKYLRSIDLTHCPLIGQGKFGQVYKLQKNFMGYEQVAIKVFYLTVSQLLLNRKSVHCYGSHIFDQAMYWQMLYYTCV